MVLFTLAFPSMQRICNFRWLQIRVPYSQDDQLHLHSRFHGVLAILILRRCWIEQRALIHSRQRQPMNASLKTSRYEQRGIDKGKPCRRTNASTSCACRYFLSNALVLSATSSNLRPQLIFHFAAPTETSPQPHNYNNQFLRP